jgi:hypothetical protein
MTGCHRLYASADFYNGDNPAGGIWKTTDGGHTWSISP